MKRHYQAMCILYITIPIALHFPLYAIFNFFPAFAALHLSVGCLIGWSARHSVTFCLFSVIGQSLLNCLFFFYISVCTQPHMNLDLFPINLHFKHGPLFLSVNFFPTFLASHWATPNWHMLPYVLPSDPHTGL